MKRSIPILVLVFAMLVQGLSQKVYADDMQPTDPRVSVAMAMVFPTHKADSPAPAPVVDPFSVKSATQCQCQAGQCNGACTTTCTDVNCPSATINLAKAVLRQPTWTMQDYGVQVQPAMIDPTVFTATAGGCTTYSTPQYTAPIGYYSEPIYYRTSSGGSACGAGGCGTSARRGLFGRRR